MQRLTNLHLIICTLLIIAFVTVPNPTKAAFEDSELQAMVKAGVIQGFGNGDLKPNVIVSRGQFATFMTRALKLPKGPHVFTDVPKSSPLANGINSAYAAGLISGYSKKTFAPEKQITRQDALSIIARVLTKVRAAAAAANPYSQFIYDPFVISNYDSTLYSPKYIDDVNLSVQYKIIRGLAYGDEGLNYHPKKLVTRAEAASFIARMLEVPTPGKVVQADPKPYKLSTVENGQIKEIEAYSTLEEAKTAINSNQFITRNGFVTYMTEGIVYLNKTLTLPENPSMNKKTDFTYEGNQEMRYLGLDDRKGSVKLQAGNRILYSTHNNVTLVPMQLLKDRSYYTVNATGDLVHKIYRPGSKVYELPYIAGKAPSFLKMGQKYYSWDGNEFFSASGTSIGKAYQYFNLISARSKSNYSAAELNKYINQVLLEREKLYKNNPIEYKVYKDATKRSKIIGLGTTLKESETEHRVNALWILSLAIQESDFGMKWRAQERNILFEFQDIPNWTFRGTKFYKPSESIDNFVEKFLNIYWHQPDWEYFYGAVFGNKSVGYNVRFENDPFWGEKVAGIMYSADKYLGGKDLGAYQIAETKEKGFSVFYKTSIDEPANTRYKYYHSGIPITFNRSVIRSEGYEWYEVVTDTEKYKNGYIREDELTFLPIVK